MDNKWSYFVEGYIEKNEFAYESIFTQSNGYLGIRGYPEEGIPGHEDIPEDFSQHIQSSPQQYVAGFFDNSPVTGNTMVNLPTLKLFHIYLNNEKLDLATGTIEDYSRNIDMKSALFIRKYIWTSPKGRKTQLIFKSFLSYSSQHLYATQLIVKSLNWSGEVLIKDICDSRGKTLRHRHYKVSKLDDSNNGYNCEISTNNSNLNAHFAFNWTADVLLNFQPLIQDNTVISKSFSFQIETEKAITLNRYLTVYTDIDIDKKDISLSKASENLLYNVNSLSWDDLYLKHSKAWADLWNVANVDIDSNDDSDNKLRYSIFLMLQSYRKGNSNISIGAKFLSGDHYSGHYFWDTETYLLPFFQYVFPDIAKDLINYRVKSLEGAKEKAKEFNCKGAFYPWEADGLTLGKENCPKWWQDEDADKPARILCGEIELHINASIAFALNNAYKTTGDLPEKWIEVIIEIARFWVSRGEWEKDLFVINNVIGPDEYHEKINNNAYTNYMAKWNIETALLMNEKLHSSILSDDEILMFKKVILNIEKCYDNNLGILAQDDTYLSLPEFPKDDYPKDQPIYKFLQPDEVTKYQITKQADIIALFLQMPFDFDIAMMQRAWDYYLPKTTHDSNLSAGAHAIVANRLGRYDEAMYYYQKVLNLDAGLGSSNVFEGLHSANAGNAWNGAVRGFAGIEIHEDILFVNPKLPENWNSISFSIKFHGRKLLFLINQKEMKLIITEGPLFKMMVKGKNLTIPTNKYEVCMNLDDKAVIFDLDGVLVDSAVCHFKAWKKIADKLNINFSEKNDHLLKGVSRRESLMIILKLGNKENDFTEEKINDLLKEKNEYYKSLISSVGDSLLLPGVKEMLSKLKAAGVTLAVASSSCNTPVLLQQAGLNKGYFDAVADGNDIINSKPDPEVFLLASKRIAIKPENCIVAEDAPAGTQGAIRAGMKVWGVGDSDLGECDLRTESINETNYIDVLNLF